MGLLDNQRVGELLVDEMRRRIAGQELKKVLDEIRSAPGEPLTTDEIQSEIKASRAERRRVKLVVDINVLVSGSLWTGSPSRLVDALLDGSATLCASVASSTVATQKREQHQDDASAPCSRAKPVRAEHRNADSSTNQYCRQKREKPHAVQEHERDIVRT